MKTANYVIEVFLKDINHKVYLESFECSDFGKNGFNFFSCPDIQDAERFCYSTAKLLTQAMNLEYADKKIKFNYRLM